MESILGSHVPLRPSAGLELSGIEGFDVLVSLFVSFEILKSLSCLLLDGDCGVGVRRQSTHLSEVTSPFFRNVLPHEIQLP